LKALQELVGQEVQPRRLLPTFKPSGYFRWACPVGKTGIFLSFDEAEKSTRKKRMAEVQVHCQGPNLGSAGGATLQPLGAIAVLAYEGLLLGEFTA
jgi:hypothetical protein